MDSIESVHGLHQSRLDRLPYLFHADLAIKRNLQRCSRGYRGVSYHALSSPAMSQLHAVAPNLDAQITAASGYRTSGTGGNNWGRQKGDMLPGDDGADLTPVLGEHEGYINFRRVGERNCKRAGAIRTYGILAILRGSEPIFGNGGRWGGRRSSITHDEIYL